MARPCEDGSGSREVLRRFEARALEFDRRLAPIADSPVELHELHDLHDMPHPLDEAGIRAETERFLEALVESYASGPEAEREVIRQLFERCRSLAWAAGWSFPPTTPERFDKHLLLFSIQNQGRDTRDAILQLRSLCQQAAEAGVDPGPGLQRVAALSDERNRFGMGSTRELLLRYQATR